MGSLPRAGGVDVGLTVGATLGRTDVLDWASAAKLSAPTTNVIAKRFFIARRYSVLRLLWESVEYDYSPLFFVA